MMRRRTRTVGQMAWGVLALLLCAGLAAHTSTMAAWTDPAVVAAQASTGTWIDEEEPDPSNPSEIVVEPGNEYTVIDSTDWSAVAANGSSFCVVLVVSGADPEPHEWELRADMSLPPFNGTTGTSNIFYSNSPAQVQFSTAPGDPSTLVITGVGTGSPPWNEAWNNRFLTDEQQITVRVCHSNTPIPAPGDADWYTVEQTPLPWTDTLACVELTATGTVTDLVANPFYFGWVGTLDLSAAKQHIVDAGRTVNYVGWAPSPSQGYGFTTSPTAYQPPADQYEITSGRLTTIRGTESTTVRACVYGY